MVGLCIAGGLCGRMEGTCIAGGHACMAGEIATAADGTHPTGMHSCFISTCHMYVECKNQK